MSPPVVDSAAYKPRNRLRKFYRHHRPGSIDSNASPRASNESSRTDSGESHGNKTPYSPKDAPVGCAPDLSSPKWQGYVRESGLLTPMETIPPPPKSTRSRSPSKLVPEFAHLALNDALRSPKSKRRAGDLSPTSPRSPSAASASSTMRRYAKTPVFRVGQLEGCEPTPPLPKKKPSDVELIAEQYRALLAARSDDDLEADDASWEADAPEADARGLDARQNSMETIRSALAKRKAPPIPPPRLKKQLPPLPLDADDDDADDGEVGSAPECSPTSDGTLVDFEEDAAIYFKPSFSPEVLTPIPEDGGCSRASSPAPGGAFSRSLGPEPDALSLQICMDLLTRELASAMPGAQPRRGAGPGAEVPQLQVWLMIEAYERLRDRVLDMHLGPEQERAVDAMLGTWLGALYKVHDGMTMTARDGGPVLQVVDLG